MPSIADHHLRDCVRVYTRVGVRAKGERERQAGHGKTAILFNLHGCELVLFSFIVS